MADATRDELKFKITELMTKHSKVIAEKDKLLNERETEINNLKNEVSALKRKSIINTSNNDKIKKVLDFHAQLLSISTIYDKMKFLGFNIYLEEIQEIINNIDSMDVELQDYFYQAQKIFTENIKIDNSVMKQTLYVEYKRLLDSISIDLSKVQDSEDIQLKINLRKEYKDVLNSISAFSKNIDDKEIADETNTIISDMEDEFENSKSNVIKFGSGFLDNVRTI